MRTNVRALLASVAALALLSGCNDFREVQDANEAIAATAANAHVPSEPIVQSIEQPYIVGDALAAQPAENAILQQRVTMLIAQPESLRDVALAITNQTGLPVDVEADADTGSGGGQATTAAVFDGSHLPPPPSAMMQSIAARPVSTPVGDGPWLKYAGTRQGLLDAVATKFGIYDRFENGRVVFFRTLTKTFTIPALYTSTKSRSEITATAGADSSSGSGSGSGGGSSGTSSNGQTTVSTESDADPWKDLEKTAEIISAGAPCVVDPGMGTVTVTGSPSQVERIAEWVDGLADTLMKQVAIDVHVYTIKINREQNYGWSPTLALKNYGKVFGLSMVPAAAPLLTSAATPFSFGASILNSATGAAGQFSGSQAVVQALATLGTVSESYEQSAVTTNGQPAPFQRGTKTGYLASTSSVIATNAGVSNSLQPGTVTSGFTGMFTPRIANGKILLRMDLDLQTLLQIQTISSGGSSIQVPITANTTIHQQATLQPGATLVLSGYANDTSNLTRNGVGAAQNWLLGGGGDAQLEKQLIAITVEARIL